MTGTQHEKRPWFQLHLSTCIVLMFVAGMLMLANFWPWIVGAENTGNMTRGPLYGFPYEFIAKNSSGLYVTWPDSGRLVSPRALILNSLAWAAILAATSFSYEYFIRRCERKREDTAP